MPSFSTSSCLERKFGDFRGADEGGSFDHIQGRGRWVEPLITSFFGDAKFRLVYTPVN